MADGWPEQGADSHAIGATHFGQASVSKSDESWQERGSSSDDAGLTIDGRTRCPLARRNSHRRRNSLSRLLVLLLSLSPALRRRSETARIDLFLSV